MAINEQNINHKHQVPGSVSRLTDNQKYFPSADSFAFSLLLKNDFISPFYQKSLMENQ